MMGLSRPFDSNLLRPAFSVGKSPITTSFCIWLLKCRQTAEISALASRPLDSACAWDRRIDRSVFHLFRSR